MAATDLIKHRQLRHNNTRTLSYNITKIEDGVEYESARIVLSLDLIAELKWPKGARILQEIVDGKLVLTRQE